ncbi:hypothetical protein JQ631_13520 [Bradyrhizobium manausense]|uniref:hypothetical protein n=1 Tax=Bradyrhizobium manausense TaxID=989370 RepID=UPI001BA514F7|nr:hypothetical protein [Bradyrhizobium manausense]MBR0790091.1 hypothetical protein [Bradyrhizobium manausense]
MSDAFDLVAGTSLMELRAKTILLQLPSAWSLSDAIGLVTEEGMSEAARVGHLQFSGLRTESAKAHDLVPTTWFEARAGKTVVAPRGFDTDHDMLCFTPLHQVQDEDFDLAADFEIKDRAKPSRWYDVLTETTTLEAFLGVLGGGMPAPPPIKRRPSTAAINGAIAKLGTAGAIITESAVVHALQNEGYAPTREPVREAIKRSGQGRKAGRPPQ